MRSQYGMRNARLSSEALACGARRSPPMHEGVGHLGSVLVDLQQAQPVELALQARELLQTLVGQETRTQREAERQAFPRCRTCLFGFANTCACKRVLNTRPV